MNILRENHNLAKRFTQKIAVNLACAARQQIVASTSPRLKGERSTSSSNLTLSLPPWTALQSGFFVGLFFFDMLLKLKLEVILELF